MLDGEVNTLDELARCWIEGDSRAGEQLKELCLPQLSEVAGQELARKWLSEVRARGPKQLGYKKPDRGGFLKWAADRLSLYARDPHRALVEEFYAGNKRAFNQLYSQTLDDLKDSLRTFRLRLAEDEIDNVLTDFFSKFYKDHMSGRSTYSPAGAPFLNWARTAVKNLARDEVRKLGRHSSESFDEKKHDRPNRRGTDSPDARLLDEGFLKRLRSEMTDEQFQVAQAFCSDRADSQKEVAELLGYTEPKVVELMKDIRAKMAKVLYDDGDRVALKAVLKWVEDKKTVKGLIPRMFLIYATHVLLGPLSKDPTWAPAAAARGLAPEKIKEVNPNSKAQVRGVAESIATLYRRVAAVNPSHEFCINVRKELDEPWCKPLAESIGREVGQALPGSLTDKDQ